MEKPTKETGETMHVCGWCNRVAGSENTWSDDELAVVADVSHGICPDCFARVMDEVDATRITE